MKANLLEALTKLKIFALPEDNVIVASIRSISETAQRKHQGCSLQVSTRE